MRWKRLLCWFFGHRAPNGGICYKGDLPGDCPDCGKSIIWDIRKDREGVDSKVWRRKFYSGYPQGAPKNAVNNLEEANKIVRKFDLCPHGTPHKDFCSECHDQTNQH